MADAYEGTPIVIKSQLDTNKCLTIPYHSQAPGEKLALYSCQDPSNYSVSGLWQTIWWMPDGTLRVHEGDATLCLDIEGASNENGAHVMQWNCHGGENQRWYATTDGQIRSAMNDKCLEVPGGDAHNGAPMVMWDCHGGLNQEWIDPPTSGSPLPEDATVLESYDDIEDGPLVGYSATALFASDVALFPCPPTIPQTPPGTYTTVAAIRLSTGELAVIQTTGVWTKLYDLPSIGGVARARYRWPAGRWPVTRGPRGSISVQSADAECRWFPVGTGRYQLDATFRKFYGVVFYRHRF